MGTSGDTSQQIRAKLLSLLEASNPDLAGQLTDETSLIRSGLVDSLGLFNLTVFIETAVGHPVDLTTFDITSEWDSVDRILTFIEAHRSST